MRGVVALAAALALPATLPNGEPFPQRDLILFLTFAVILVTLVLQGLTLPLIIRKLGLAGVSGPDCEEPEARRLMIEAALRELSAARDLEPTGFNEVYDDIDHHYQQRLALVGPDGKPKDGDAAEQHARYRDLSLDLLRVERHTAIQLRNEGRINDELLRRLEHELDLSEAKYSAMK